MNWRILNIDGFRECFEAWRAVRTFYGAAIPVRLYRALKNRQFNTILYGFTIRKDSIW